MKKKILVAATAVMLQTEKEKNIKQYLQAQHIQQKLCKSCCAEQYHQNVFHQQDTVKQHKFIRS